MNRTTNNYLVAGDQIAWKQEKLVVGDFTETPGTVSHPDTAALLTYRAYADLEREVISPYSLKVFLQGSVGQRPLISYAADVSTGYDYFVIADRLYLNFDLADTDTVYVDYVGIPQPGDPTALDVGAMDMIALPAPYVAPSGYILADGTTCYSIMAYAALYAKLLADGADIMIAYEAGESNTAEQYCTLGGAITSLDAATGFVVPPGSFVVRYLDPTTFSALPDPVVTDPVSYRSRSATHRVVIKT